MLVSTAEGAVLHSMSGEFKLLVHQSDGCSSINFEFAKSDVGSSREMKFIVRAAIDDDAFSKIKDEFFSFPICGFSPDEPIARFRFGSGCDSHAIG